MDKPHTTAASNATAPRAKASPAPPSPVGARSWNRSPAQSRNAPRAVAVAPTGDGVQFPSTYRNAAALEPPEVLTSARGRAGRKLRKVRRLKFKLPGRRSLGGMLMRYRGRGGLRPTSSRRSVECRSRGRRAVLSSSVQARLIRRVDAAKPSVRELRCQKHKRCPRIRVRLGHRGPRLSLTSRTRERPVRSLPRR